MINPLRERGLASLYEIVEFALNLHATDSSRVWPRLLDKLAVAFDAEAATYYDYSPQKRELTVRYAMGPNTNKITGLSIGADQGICGWVAVHHEPVAVANAYEDERFLRHLDQTTGFRTQTVLALPLLDRMDLIGVLEVFNKRSGPFTAEDLRFAEAACRVTALGLRNAHLEDTVEKVSQRNASILENLSGGFLAIDLHGRIIFSNPAARRILGLKADAPMTGPAADALLQVPKIADILLQTLASRRTAKRQEFALTAGGRARTIGYSTILIQDPSGSVTGAGITFQDITPAAKQ